MLRSSTFRVFASLWISSGFMSCNLSGGGKSGKSNGANAGGVTTSQTATDPYDGIIKKNKTQEDDDENNGSTCLNLQDSQSDASSNNDIDESLSGSRTAFDTALSLNEFSVRDDEGMNSDGCGRPKKPMDGGGMNGSWDAGEGLEGCRDRGVAWQAVVLGQSGQCSTEKLVSWCCSEEMILAKFPTMASTISPRFTEFKNQGLILYNCSESADKTTFHFGKFSDGAMSYRTLFVTGKGKDVSEPSQCKIVTSADLGISPEEAIPDSENIPSSPPSSIPSSIVQPIGEIAQTSRAALLEWVKGEPGGTPPPFRYRSWQARDFSCVDIAGHNAKGKRYYSPVLADGLIPTTFSSNQNTLARGSLAVMELYDSTCTVVNSVFLFGRGLDREVKTPQAWLMYQENGGPNFSEASAAAYGMGVAACASCHVYGKVNRPSGSMQDVDVVLRSTPLAGP